MPSSCANGSPSSRPCHLACTKISDGSSQSSSSMLTISTFSPLLSGEDFRDTARPKWEFQLVFEVADPGGIAFRFVVAVHHDLYLNAFLAGLVDFVFSHVSWRQILCRR